MLFMMTWAGLILVSGREEREKGHGRGGRYRKRGQIRKKREGDRRKIERENKTERGKKMKQ